MNVRVEISAQLYSRRAYYDLSCKRVRDQYLQVLHKADTESAGESLPTSGGPSASGRYRFGLVTPPIDIFQQAAGRLAMRRRNPSAEHSLFTKHCPGKSFKVVQELSTCQRDLDGILTSTTQTAIDQSR